jgi:outer membrane protein OmpA-like peptidoglycan-associated protein
MRNISLYRIIPIRILVCWAVLCARDSWCQQEQGWANGESLPANARRTVREMKVGSKPFQMGKSLLGLADNGLEMGLVQLEEQFKNIRIEDDEMKLRIVFDSDILFDFDKSSIRPDAETSLQAVASVLKQHKGKTIRIVGHTDSKGSDEYNNTLSRKRAESVKAWLSARSELEGVTLVASGRGELEPIVPNTLSDGSDNPSGRQKNRRVEIEIPK